MSNKSPFEKKASNIEPEAAVNKPKMMEEIPEERDIKVENESQRSAKDRQKMKEGDPEGSPEQRDQFVKFANSEEAKVKDYK